MKAVFKTSSGRISFEITADDAKGVFEGIAQAQEIFDAEKQCGMCSSPDIHFQFRQADDFKFYQLHCSACHAEFSFGQKKKGGALFPRRKDDDGNLLPHGGWAKYQRPGAVSEPAAAKPQPEAAAAAKQHSDGVPSFGSWKEAENSQRYGEKYLRISGKLFMMTADGANYNQVRENTRA